MNRVLAKCAAHPIRRVQAFAFAEKTPPAEIQIWNVGDNPTDYGIHRWTDRSVVEVMTRYESRGNPILVDVEHNGATAGGDDLPVIGGYARLEIRGGAPWLVFDWSEYAVEQIATGQRRFLSPEYDVDTDTGEIVRLYRVSLVADPATYRARMLASAEAARKGETIVNLAMILAALRAALAAEDPAVAKESINNLVAELSKESEGAPAADPLADGESPPSSEDVNAAGAPPTPPAPPEKKPVAAAAPEPAHAPTPAPTPAAPVVASAPPAPAPDPNARVLAELDGIKRDALLRDEGDRLPEPVRVWASAQPYEVVKSLVAASPKRLAPVGQVRATRGERHGVEDAHRRGLEGKELEELQRAMGTFRASTPAVPHVNGSGEFVLPLRTPTEAREQAAAAAKKGGV